MPTEQEARWGPQMVSTSWRRDKSLPPSGIRISDYAARSLVTIPRAYSKAEVRDRSTGLFISPSGTSELDCATTRKDRIERSISIGRESLIVFFCTRGLGVLAGRWPRPASSFRSAQAATLLEFHVPLTNCFVRRWFCAVYGPKPPLHRHN